MDRFAGRTEELRVLEDVLGSDHRACAVSGPARIGKSQLLREFCRDRRSIHITFFEGSASQNLDRLSEGIGLFLGKDVGIGSYAEGMGILKDICGEERTVLVLDEYTLASQSAPGLPSAVRDLTDHIIDRTESMIVLCGSDQSALEDEIGSPGMPLCGLFPTHIRVGPLGLRETLGLHPGMGRADALKLHLTLGGIPAYHLLADGDTYRGNIEKCFLETPGYLSEEAFFIVGRRLDGWRKYVRILDAIGGGASTIRGVASKCGISETLAGQHLSHLSGIGVVAPLVPMAGANRREKRFVISDPLVAFHYGAVMRRQPLPFGEGVDCYGEMLPSISGQLERSFEILCRDFVAGTYDCDEVGSWWDEGGAGIDIVAAVNGTDGRIDLFGECSLRARKMGMSDLRTLESRVENLHGRFNPRLILFSASGFDEDLTEHAADIGVLLIDTDILFGDRPAPPL